MIPGEILTKTDDVVLNADKDPIRLTVANTCLLYTSPSPRD